MRLLVASTHAGLVLLGGCGTSNPGGDVEVGDDQVGTAFDEEPCAFTDVGAIVNGYDPARWTDSVLPLLEARYPTGARVLRETADARDCSWAGYVDDPSTFEGMVPSLATVVHEMGHCWGMQRWLPDYHFLINEETVVVVPYRETFARAGVVGVHEFPDQDLYLPIYLSGAMGRQGLHTLLDELNQYTHSLAVGTCTRDLAPGGTSHRDGVLVFLYYLEKYLQVARSDWPDQYDAMQHDPALIELIDVLWNRAQLLLERSEGQGLGLLDATIAPFVYDGANVEHVRALLEGR